MSVNALVHATASLSLQYQCCDHCCKPIFFFCPDDRSEEILSRSSRHKFYVVKKGSVGSEGIYTEWYVSMLDYVHATDAENCRDVAKTKVNRISGALHEASKTADSARTIWVRYCHRFHTHAPSPAAAVARPPPYEARTPAPSP
jgi:hypothetical protein